MPRHRRIPHLLAALVACGVMVLSACSSSSGGTDFRFTAPTKLDTLIGQTHRKYAQDVGGELISGGKTSLSADKGKVTVLNFWATWCGPCKIETPQLDSLYRQMKSQGVRFIGFDTKDDKGAARDFIRQNKITYPIVYDQPAKNGLKLGNFPVKLPTTVLIDKQGKVAAIYQKGLSPKDLTGPLATLLAER